MFNAFRSTYEIKVWPQAQGSFLALLSLRHPNVSSSFRLAAFRLTAAPNPEAPPPAASSAPTASAPATAGGATSTATAAALLAAAGPVFNPLLHPRISLVATFPAVSAASYGGGTTKLMADFRAIVAFTAALTGPDWVIANLTNAAPATVNATVRCACWAHGCYRLPPPCVGACSPLPTQAHAPPQSAANPPPRTTCRRSCGSRPTTPTSLRPLTDCPRWTTSCSS